MVAIYEAPQTIMQTLGMNTTTVIDGMAEPVNTLPEIKITAKRTYWWLIAVIVILLGGLLAFKK